MTRVLVLRINSNEIGNWEEFWIINKKNEGYILDRIKLINKIRINSYQKVQVKAMIQHQGIKKC
jgi:hypothetical protein